METDALPTVTAGNPLLTDNAWPRGNPNENNDIVSNGLGGSTYGIALGASLNPATRRTARSRSSSAATKHDTDGW